MKLFSKRTIHFQAWSNLLSLPMEWNKSEAHDCKIVFVQMDLENNLLIAPGEVYGRLKT